MYRIWLLLTVALLVAFLGLAPRASDPQPEPRPGAAAAAAVEG
ncbi:hypothetical protein PYK79_45085 [Streptomyces sp. ID05-04B]|nr:MULTISPECIES: hypothetical protein [unclassified Streptomyces]MDX5569023.1 hypothetical protein [Streptomyces sp. ID05-04B]